MAERDKSTNYKWPIEATDIVMEGVRNHARPTVIRRNLKDSNVFGGQMPSKVQLYNKIAATKLVVFPSSSVKNTHELRMKIAKLLEEPASELEAFVPHHEIDDEDDNKEPRFNIYFSTKKNLGKLQSHRLLQTDATYRLNWMGFPVYVGGMCTFKEYDLFQIFYHKRHIHKSFLTVYDWFQIFYHKCHIHSSFLTVCNFKTRVLFTCDI